MQRISIDWLDEVADGEYGYLEGEQGEPGSLVVLNERGSTLIGQYRVSALEECESREDAVACARQWAAQARES
jgi:hypothetical protein